MATSASVENIFAEVFVLVIVTSVCCFGQLTHRIAFVGTGRLVIGAAFVLVGEVVTVVVTTSPAFEAVITKADGVVVVVFVSTGNEIIDGAFGRAVTDDNLFELNTGFLHISVLRVVAAVKEDVVVGNVGNKFFPSGVELVTLVVLVEAVAKETISSVGFHDVVAVFVFDGEVTVEGLTSVLVIVTRRAGQALIVYFDPVRTVFECT